jgi:hypothetical protein
VVIAFLLAVLDGPARPLLNRHVQRLIRRAGRGLSLEPMLRDAIARACEVSAG